MQWRKKQRVLYVIGSANHALLIKQYRDDADCLYSTNEDDGDADHAAASPTATNGPGSYARAAQPGRGKPGSKPRPSGYQPAYYRPHRSMPDSRQPLVTTEKKTFNEEEYTKITTPRQDVLFKKGYLGRKKTVASGPTASGADSTSTAAAAAAVTGAALTATNCIELAPMHNGGDCEPQPGEQADVMSPTDEQPQYIYPNGYVDGVIYVNGGYEWYDPYGNVTVVVGPAPPFAGPGGGASVLAAVPCQPLPLQPIEWFNPAYGVPYVAPALPSCPRERDRRKRCSADSQNCSPQSSESTDPPGSPQEGEGEGECEGDGEVDDGMLSVLPAMINGTDEYAVYPHSHPVQPHAPPQPQAYMYPGAYMFGQPIYSMNGITVQSTSQLPQNSENSGSKRRKKKRRRRRRRGGVDDGSEETSSDEKDLEEPVSLTSQESSQEVESDSKNSAGSASCPTIVGCPELPERTPESPSSSPSLSPSLSPSPSPSNATDDKTALPKVNYVDTNAQEENPNVRSEGSTENADTLVNKSSLQGVDGNNSLSHFLSVENSEDICKLHETNLQIQKVTCNGDPNVDQILEIDASKTNGNYLVDDGKSLELDNNLPAIDSSTVSACGDSEIEISVELNKERVTKSNVQVSKSKSKGKKGLKAHKQKGQLPIQNGLSDLQVSECSGKTQETRMEMDGNETQQSLKDEVPSNRIQSQSVAQNIVYHAESGISPGHILKQDEITSKCNLDLSGHSSDAPKKPARTHHQNHQQQKSELSQLPHSVFSPQGVQSSCSTSTTLEDKQIKGELSKLHDSTVPLFELNPNIDVTATVVPISETKLPQKECDQCSAVENVEIRINLHEKTTSENGNSLVQEHAKEITTEAVVCEVGQSKTWPNEDVDQIFIKETSDKQESESSYAQQDNSKDLRNLSITRELDTIKHEKSLSSCRSNLINNNVKESLSTFSEQGTSVPPVPPPRRKKWQSSRKCSSEHPLSPGKELEAKKQREILDDSSSSSSRESEESVIDLLSSSPNKSRNSREFVNEALCITTDLNVASNAASLDSQPNTVLQIVKSSGKDILLDTKLTDEEREGKKLRGCKGYASEPDQSTTCISKQSQQTIKGDQSQCKRSEFKGGLHPEENCNDAENLSQIATDDAAKTFADDLACQVLGEGLSSAATTMNKAYQSPSLSLTEAVTQWLHSQDSEEVLQIPQLLESESDTEDAEEASEEETQATGPKNVYRNPLLAPSCESQNKHDDAGTRVANLENTNSLKTQKEIASCRRNQLPNSLTIKDSVPSNNTVKRTKQYVSEFNKMHEQHTENLPPNSISHAGCSTSELTKIRNGDARSTSSGEFGMDNSKQHSQGSKYDECNSFTGESVEYDADWENDPVMLKPSPRVTVMVIKDDEVSHLSLESTDDKCSYMCDPAISVAKYYRLGPPPEKDINGKDMATDFDSGKDDNGDDTDNDDDCGDGVEGMDALIHFRNELNENLCSPGVGVKFHFQRYSAGGSKLPLTKKNIGETNLLQKNEEIYDASYDGFTSDSGIHSEESCNEECKVINSNSKSISETNSILKRKSAILLSHLGAESPFPCGGICCILQ